MAIVPVLAAFLFLSPGEDAGLAPVRVPRGGNRSAFVKDALTARAVAFEELPAHNLLASWKKLGVTVLADVPFDRESSGEFFRRQCGFAAFQRGADGVWTAKTADLPSAWQAALAAAKDDVAVVAALEELAVAAMASKDSSVCEAGRRARHFLVQMKVDVDGLDVLRQTAVAEVRTLEKALGRPAAALPEKPAGLPVGTVKFTPFTGESVETVSVRGEGTTTLAPWISLSTGYETFAFELPGADDSDGLYRFRLYVPSLTKGEWVPHRFTLDRRPPEGPRARLIGSGLNGTRERFSDKTVRRCQPSDLFAETPVRTPVDDARPLVVNRYTSRVNRLPFAWECLRDRIPLASDGPAHVWYLFAESPKGESGRWKLVWPKGSSARLSKFKVSGVKTEKVQKTRVDEISLDEEE